MNRKECRITRQEIEQSELNQRLSDQTLRHLESCPACSQFRNERTRLRELVGSLEPVAAPGDFDIRLRARIAAERQSNAPPSFFARFAVGTPAIAVAALVVTLGASIVWYAQYRRNQTPTLASGPSATTEKVISSPSDKSSVTGSEADVTNPNPTLVAQASRDREQNSSREAVRRLSLARGRVRPATDFDVSAAESIRQGVQGADEVSLSAPVMPMVVSMQDNSGAKRRISLPPVSFGSQRLVDNRVPVSSNSRSW